MTRRTVVEREAARLAEELPLSDAERTYVAGSMRRVERAALARVRKALWITDGVSVDGKPAVWLDKALACCRPERKR